MFGVAGDVVGDSVKFNERYVKFFGDFVVSDRAVARLNYLDNAFTEVGELFGSFGFAVEWCAFYFYCFSNVKSIFVSVSFIFSMNFGIISLKSDMY